MRAGASYQRAYDAVGTKFTSGVPMQFRLRSLFIFMALVCVYLGVVNMPTFFAFPLFCAVVLVSPAYWVTGAIYARDQRRAFFIGALAAGVLPYLILAYNAQFLIFRGGPWGWDYRFGETQLANVFVSLFVFAPPLIAYLGGWIALAVYRS